MNSKYSRWHRALHKVDDYYEFIKNKFSPEIHLRFFIDKRCVDYIPQNALDFTVGMIKKLFYDISIKTPIKEIVDDLFLPCVASDCTAVSMVRFLSPFYTNISETKPYDFLTIILAPTQKSSYCSVDNSHTVVLPVRNIDDATEKKPFEITASFIEASSKIFEHEPKNNHFFDKEQAYDILSFMSIQQYLRQFPYLLEFLSGEMHVFDVFSQKRIPKHEWGLETLYEDDRHKIIRALVNNEFISSPYVIVKEEV